MHINLFIKVKNVGGEGQSSPKKHPTIMHVDCKQQNTRKCLYMMMKIKNDEGANCNAICFFKLGNIFTPIADFLEKTTFEKSLVWLVLSLSLTSYPSACLTLKWIGEGKEQLLGGIG